MTGYERTPEDARAGGWQDAGKEGGREGGRASERSREEGFCAGRITAVSVAAAILRTFTASQFFRLIIQRARGCTPALTAIASDGTGFGSRSEILEMEKSNGAGESEKLPGDRSLKNVIRFRERAPQSLVARDGGDARCETSGRFRPETPSDT